MARPAQRLACLIASRNLGDIVMAGGLLRQLAAAHYALGYLVWTRPEMACLFEDLPDCEVICSAFPVGTGRRFGARDLARMLAAAAQIRARSPSVVIDFIGDFRERALARLIGGRHLQIGWGPGHRQHHLIRNPFGPGHPLVTVPASVPGVYAGHQRMLEALTGTAADPAAAADAPRAPIRRIGLHPFASQPSKLWPQQSWRELAQGLDGAGLELWAFSSPQEAAALRGIFLGLPVLLRCTDIRQYCRDVQQLDLVIGLDSLSVHMAHRFGVRSIMINSGNPPELYAVPGGLTLAATGGCPHHPCYNTAPCRGGAHEYACVRAVTPQQVLAAVRDLARARASVAVTAPVAAAPAPLPRA
jgi:heptosyltransferase-3